jgi:hypothetical protein
MVSVTSWNIKGVGKSKGKIAGISSFGGTPHREGDPSSSAPK